MTSQYKYGERRHGVRYISLLTEKDLRPTCSSDKTEEAVKQDDVFKQSKDGNQSAPKLLVFFDASSQRHVNALRVEHKALKRVFIKTNTHCCSQKSALDWKRHSMPQKIGAK